MLSARRGPGRTPSEPPQSHGLAQGQARGSVPQSPATRQPEGSSRSQYGAGASTDPGPGSGQSGSPKHHWSENGSWMCSSHEEIDQGHHRPLWGGEGAKPVKHTALMEVIENVVVKAGAKAQVTCERETVP